MREAESKVKYSTAQVDAANRVFAAARTPITPDMSNETIRQNAGIVQVLDWLKQNEGNYVPMRPRDVQ